MFLVNAAIVCILLMVSVRRVFTNKIDSVLAVITLFWGVGVTAGVLLSFISQLANSYAWFVVSTLVAFSIWIVLSKQTVPEETAKQMRFELWAILAATAILVALNVFVALRYPPNNWDSNTYHIPRAILYMSQGNLQHFETVNLRQVFLTFNPTIIIIWIISFGLSEPLINLINPACLLTCFLSCL